MSAPCMFSTIDTTLNVYEKSFCRWFLVCLHYICRISFDSLLAIFNSKSHRFVSRAFKNGYVMYINLWLTSGTYSHCLYFPGAAAALAFAAAAAASFAACQSCLALAKSRSCRISSGKPFNVVLPCGPSQKFLSI